MSTTDILISNSIMKRFSYRSVLTDKFVQIALNCRCQTGFIKVASEYGLVGKDTG